VYGDHLEQISGIVLPADFRERPLAALQVRLPAPANKVARRLADAGIETRQWYCPPLHRHAAFARFERVGEAGSDRLTLTDELTTASLGLPWHSFLTLEDIARVCESLEKALSDIG
jgi:dTDP-4-amino-4,6-dideoxygalactose transaminase